MKNGKLIWKIIGTIFAFAVGGTLASIFDVTDNLRAIWVLPE